MSDATPHKPGWGQCPPADLPLRQTLPKLRPETRRRLLRFGAGQLFLSDWLCDRAEAYGQAHGPQIDAYCYMAVACLDLLTWQADGLADKAALDRLPTDAELHWEKREAGGGRKNT
jgi:hypothetical protein